ncbi:hypothetical protein IEN85_23650 [Pelagicoccus sp. NFK12]|uniref:DUF3566 domain-containing protein n=1 Tax=Pelagicoccus enzymogenes TaxID=2773457 RepID=A0A927FCV3_9BACT|nr:hypothetical protein [Pelagicoccus enzymogenes]MBD5782514.1 hypothetical protein [Pelagicoccus enzymogenes]MDQ8199572.1 hypothetical protein [Pelagicoccus enzymogenes]
MKVTLKQIPPLPAAKLVAVIYGCFSLIFIPFFAIAAIGGFLSGEEGAGIAAGMGIVMAILMPLFYVAMGFVATLVGCFIYNIAAGWVGGIELEFDESSIES